MGRITHTRDPCLNRWFPLLASGTLRGELWSVGVEWPLSAPANNVLLTMSQYVSFLPDKTRPSSDWQGPSGRVTDSSGLDWGTNGLWRAGGRFASEKIRVASGSSAKMHRCFCHTVMATEALRRSLPVSPASVQTLPKSHLKCLWFFPVDPGVHLQLITLRRKRLLLEFCCVNETFATPAFDYSLISEALFSSWMTCKWARCIKKSIIQVHVTSAEHLDRPIHPRRSHLSWRAPLFPRWPIRSASSCGWKHPPVTASSSDVIDSLPQEGGRGVIYLLVFSWE